jgi:hypothetical protein
MTAFATEAYPGQIEAYAETILRIELAVSATGDHGSGVRGFQELAAAVETLSTDYIAQRDALHRIEIEVAPFVDAPFGGPHDIADRVETLAARYAIKITPFVESDPQPSPQFDTIADPPEKRSIWQRLTGRFALS